MLRSPARPLSLDSSTTVGLPGFGTSAHILWRTWLSHKGLPVPRETFLRFDLLPGAVVRGGIDAAVVIHESRFTFQEAGLAEVVDLGRFWDETHHLPVPLGCLLVRRSLGDAFAANALERVRRSLDDAWARSEPSTPWIRSHAQELEPEVIRKHIEAYVTPRSRDCGEDGLRAMETLWDLAETHLDDAGAGREQRKLALEELRSLLR